MFKKFIFYFLPINVSDQHLIQYLEGNQLFRCSNLHTLLQHAELLQLEQQPNHVAALQTNAVQHKDYAAALNSKFQDRIIEMHYKCTLEMVPIRAFSSAKFLKYFYFFGRLN